jgi:glycosyltransferase involved in cell wall biosynthesis
MPPRLALICDYREEQWPSMDLVAEMLEAQLMRRHADEVAVTALRAPYRRLFGGLARAGAAGAARNADRLLNRMLTYPRWLRGRRTSFDVFHVCDHSYSQVVHALPAERTGVFCHDLDTFRSILAPASEPRPRWFRAMARRILRGMQKAAVVFYATEDVRRQIESHGLVDPTRLVHAPPGVAEEFTMASVTDDDPHDETVRAVMTAPFVLNVGSTIPRKRIDVLLDVFAAIAPRHPELRLVQIGGEWTEDQRRQIERLNLGPRVRQLQGLSRRALASLYRQASVVVQLSDAEGFGLPIVEALACGATVVASDIPVFREVGGDAVVYRAVADVAAWADTIDGVLSSRITVPPETRAARAATYSWSTHADTIVSTYLQLLK